MEHFKMSYAHTTIARKYLPNGSSILDIQKVNGEKTARLIVIYEYNGQKYRMNVPAKLSGRK
jgi:hypothetical protein